MSKTMKKRSNGTGSIEVRKDRTNPFIAKVGCSVIDQKTGEVKYKYKKRRDKQHMSWSVSN